MQVKALKSFQGRHGFIRAGDTVNLEDGYARDLAKNGLVQLPKSEGDGGPKAPAANIALGGRGRPSVQRPEAPRPGKQQPPLGDGNTLTPLSSRAARVRAEKTPKKSASGAKKGGGAKSQERKDQNPDDAV